MPSYQFYTKGAASRAGILSIFVAASFFISHTAHAAILSLYATDGAATHAVGQVFSVAAYVSTPADAPMNAVSATVSFPAAQLQLVSIDKTGSVVDFWISNDFSNSAGTVNFEGGTYNPGFSGTRGKVATLVFKVKAVGSGTLSFLSADVLANDGRGTNILDQADPITIRTSPANGQSYDDVNDSAQTQSINITSSTHPDQTRWYKSTSVDLSWKLAADVDSVRMSVDRFESSLPGVTYTPPILSKHLDLSSGTWYFHIQARDSIGWGSITNFKIQIDTDPPQPVHITFPHGASTNDPRPIALFNTTDSLSGIDHYDIIISGAGTTRVTNKEAVLSNPYALPIQDPGDHTIQVIAYDNAGNSATAASAFSVQGIDPPTFDTLPDSIVENDSLQFSGTTYPKATVSVFITDGDGNRRTQSVIAGAVAGRFLLLWSKHLVAGDYTMTAQVVDENGAKSRYIPEHAIKVELPAFERIGVPLLNVISLTALIVGAIAGLVAWTWYLFHKLKKFHANLKRRIVKTDEHIHNRFRQFSTTVLAQIQALESVSIKRPLNEDERKLVTALKESIDSIEAEIRDEVDNFNV